MRMYDELRETHPHLGKAAYAAWYESDLTGDYPGQQFCEIVNFEESTGRCSRCGSTERRQRIDSHLLVGANKGQMHTLWSADCTRRGCGAMSSNYRAPWATTSLL